MWLLYFHKQYLWKDWKNTLKTRFHKVTVLKLCELHSAEALKVKHGFVYSIVLQIGEEMSQNSFIQQYLAKQQELLRQRLEREAQQDDDADGITVTWTYTVTKSDNKDSLCHMDKCPLV